MSRLSILEKGFTPFRNKKFLTGFTFLEILLVLGIILVLLAVAWPIGLDFYRGQEFETQTQFLIQTLRRAQSNSMAIELDSSFGVYVGNNYFTLFKGNSYASPSRDIQYDEIFYLPDIISASGISEVVFSKFEGKPNIVGDIILASDSNVATININTMGRINLQ